MNKRFKRATGLVLFILLLAMLTAVALAAPDVTDLAAGYDNGRIHVTGQSGAEGVAQGITNALSPMLIGLIRVLAMLVLFLLLTIAIRAVATLLTGLFELPVLHGLNSVLGAVFGCLLAVLFLWIGLACVQVFLPMLGADIQNAFQTVLGESVFAEALYRFNPAYLLIG